MSNTRLTAAAAAAIAMLGLMGASTSAVAADGPWLVRARLVQLNPDNKDDTNLGLDLNVNSKLIPEVDVSYFFTPNIAAELILTYPQKHNLKAGSAVIGSLKHLPPTLSLQYHFTDLGAFKPYVGLGLNYTMFSDVDAPAGVTIKHNSAGLAYGAGFDYELSKGLYLNFDVKKVHINTTVYAAGVDSGKLKVDPLLIGVGVGWRF